MNDWHTFYATQRAFVKNRSCSNKNLACSQHCELIFRIYKLAYRLLYEDRGSRQRYPSTKGVGSDPKFRLSRSTHINARMDCLMDTDRLATTESSPIDHQVDWAFGKISIVQLPYLTGIAWSCLRTPWCSSITSIASFTIRNILSDKPSRASFGKSSWNSFSQTASLWPWFWHPWPYSNLSIFGPEIHRNRRG